MPANDNFNFRWPNSIFNNGFGTSWPRGGYVNPTLAVGGVPGKLPDETIKIGGVGYKFVPPNYADETMWPSALKMQLPIEGCTCVFCEMARERGMFSKKLSDKVWEALNKMSFTPNLRESEDTWDKYWREAAEDAEAIRKVAAQIGERPKEDEEIKISYKRYGNNPIYMIDETRMLTEEDWKQIAEGAKRIQDNMLASGLSAAFVSGDLETFVAEMAAKQKAELEAEAKRWEVFQEAQLLQGEIDKLKAWITNGAQSALDDDDIDDDYNDDDLDEFDDDNDDDLDDDDEEDDFEDDEVSAIDAEEVPMFNRAVLPVIHVLQDLSDILEVRGTNYNHPADNFQVIADGWTWYARAKGLLAPGKSFNTDDVGDFEEILKMSRGIFGPMDDHDLDVAGYAIGKLRARDEIARRQEIADAEANSADLGECPYCVKESK